MKPAVLITAAAVLLLIGLGSHMPAPGTVPCDTVRTRTEISTEKKLNDDSATEISRPSFEMLKISGKSMNFSFVSF